jgi:hypothetical protein
MKFKILGIFTGQIAKLSNNTESAITKTPKAMLTLRKDSIEHDEVANKKHHDQGYGTKRFSDIEFLKQCMDTGLMDKGWKPKIENVPVKN